MIDMKAKVGTSSGNFSCNWIGELQMALMTAVNLVEGFTAKYTLTFRSGIHGNPLDGTDDEWAARVAIARAEAHKWIDMIFDAEEGALHW